MIDLLDLVRSIAAAAERAAENKNYPVPCGPTSPLLASVRQACVERGYTAGGLAVPGVTAEPAPAGTAVATFQPIIGRLMDQISALPVLWGLNEPGALLRNSDVFRVLTAAGREQEASAQAQEPVAKTLVGRDDAYADAIEDIAHALAQELEDAALDRNDLVTVNRAKLALIAQRVLAKAGAAPMQSVAVRDDWRAAIDGLMDFAPTNDGPLPGMTRGGIYVRKDSVIAALSSLAAPAAQGDAKDTERLRWLAETGARISWSMDGEYCAVWLPDERDGTESRPAEGYPLKCYDSWHRAIDAAIAAKAAS